MKSAAVILIAIATLIGFSGVTASQEDASQILEEAIQHYQNRDEKEQVLQSIELLQQVLELDPENYDAAWRLARAFWYQGNFNEHDKKKSYFEKGIEAGKKAIEINSSACKGYFWLGVNYALYAENAGILEAYGLIDQVKEQMNKAIEIDKSCECGGPQRVLGKLYSRIPFFKGGSKEKATEYLQESLNLCPQDTQSRIFLAELYIDEGKKGLAIQQLKLVLKQEPDPEWLPETRVNKEVAERMLSELENHKKK